MYAFVGSRTTRARNARGIGLSVYKVASGSDWQLRQTLDLINPSYLLVDAQRRTLYAVHGDFSDISAFSIGGSGRLTFLNQRPIRGHNPVHLALAPKRSHVVVANHATGSLSSLPIAVNGALGEVESTLTFSGTPGPRRDLQTGSHPHQVLPWPGTDRLLVPDKGLDVLHVVHIDEEGGLQAADALHMARGAGCRHAVLDVERGWLWVANELAVSVTFCQIDARSGQLERVTTVPLLHECPAHGHSVAGIVRQADMLYASIRGADVVVALRIDQHRGTVTTVQRQATGGRTPRFIVLSPDGRDLLVANEDSDNVVRCPIGADGLLEAPQNMIQTGSPVCIAFIDP